MEIPVAVRTFLDERRFGVLATVNPDGTPQQTVMWFTLHGDTIMMNTAQGRVKASNLRNDPRVSICVEDEYTYVTAFGRAELIDDQEVAQRDIAELAVRYNGADRAQSQIAEFRKQTRITILVPIERLISSGL
ncbi:MAG TPA: PPOX class F420-dependent oxidoreductase [Thermomicrobiaceae bacterium]|nr:PPOX class F420-dependent oxidoreductase [Thermomicrobiaceae bacterium]